MYVFGTLSLTSDPTPGVIFDNYLIAGAVGGAMRLCLLSSSYYISDMYVNTGTMLSMNPTSLM